MFYLCLKIINYQLSIINYLKVKYKFLSLFLGFGLLSYNAHSYSGVGGIFIYEATTNKLVDLNPFTGSYELIRGSSYYYKGSVESKNFSENYNHTFTLYYQGTGSNCVIDQSSTIDPVKVAACNNCTPRRYQVANPDILMPEGPAISCTLTNAVPHSDGNCYPEIPCTRPAPGRRCISQLRISQPPTVFHEYCPIVEKSILTQISGTTNGFSKNYTSATFTIPNDALHSGAVRVNYPFYGSNGAYVNDARFKTYIITNNNTIYVSTGEKLIRYASAPTIGRIWGTVPRGGEGANYVYQWQKNDGGFLGWENIAGANSRYYTPGVITRTTAYRRLAGPGTSISNQITFQVLPPRCEDELLRKPILAAAYLNNAAGCPTTTVRVSLNSFTEKLEAGYFWTYETKFKINATGEIITSNEIWGGTMPNVPYIDIDVNNSDYYAAITATSSTTPVSLTFTMQLNLQCGEYLSVASNPISIAPPKLVPTSISVIETLPVSLGFSVPPNPNNKSVLLGNKSYAINAQPESNCIYTITPTNESAVGAVPSKIIPGGNFANVVAGNLASEGFTIRARVPGIPAGCPNAISKKYDIVSDATVATAGYMFDLYSTGKPYRGKSYIRVPAANDPNINSGTIRFDFGVANFTMEAWIQGKTNSYDLEYYPIFSNWNSRTQGGFRFGVNPKTNKVFFFGPTQLFESAALPTGSFTDNTCRHVAVVRQGKTMKFYINGTQSGATQTINGTMNISNGNSYLIGTDTEDQTDKFGNKLPINNFVGVIREARLWKKPQSQQFISNNMSKKITPTTGTAIASYLRLNDGAGTVALDIAKDFNQSLSNIQLNGIGLYYDYMPGRNPTSGSTANWSQATCGEMIFRKSATEEEPAPITDIETLLKDIAIYPNPTENEIVVKIPTTYLETATLLSIISLNGSLLYQSQLSALENKLDLKAIVKTKGIYFIKIANDTDSKHFKVALND